MDGIHEAPHQKANSLTESPHQDTPLKDFNLDFGFGAISTDDDQNNAAKKGNIEEEELVRGKDFMEVDCKLYEEGSASKRKKQKSYTLQQPRKVPKKLGLIHVFNRMRYE